MKILEKLSFLNKTLGILDNQNVNVNHLILEAHRLGVRVNVYADQVNRNFQYADNVIVGSLNDKNKLKQFANPCQWVIYVSSVGVNNALINYLKQFTAVPQGTDELDLLNDQSILHVFLDSLHVPSLPYITVFSMDDVKQALTDIDLPIMLRPVQTDYRKWQTVLVTNEDQLSNLNHLFHGEAYLLESLPKDSRYFNLTLFTSNQRKHTFLPMIETHYQGSKFNFANLSSKLSPEIVQLFHKSVQLIADQLEYVGGLTFSCVLTKDHQVFVNGLSLPLNFQNNVFNQTNDDVSQLILKTLLGVEIAPLKPLDQVYLIKLIDHDDVEQAQQLWIQNHPIYVNLDPLINNEKGQGYALISAKSLDDAKEALQKSQL